MLYSTMMAIAVFLVNRATFRLVWEFGDGLENQPFPETHVQAFTFFGVTFPLFNSIFLTAFCSLYEHVSQDILYDVTTYLIAAEGVGFIMFNFGS